MALLRRAARRARATTSTSRCTTACVSASANLLGPALAEDRQQEARARAHDRRLGVLPDLRSRRTGATSRSQGRRLKFAAAICSARSAAPSWPRSSHEPAQAALLDRTQQPVEQFLRRDLPLPDARSTWVGTPVVMIDVCFGEESTPHACRHRALRDRQPGQHAARHDHAAAGRLAARPQLQRRARRSAFASANSPPTAPASRTMLAMAGLSLLCSHSLGTRTAADSVPGCCALAALPL